MIKAPEAGGLYHSALNRKLLGLLNFGKDS
jgi:hypothetical protein